MMHFTAKDVLLNDDGRVREILDTNEKKQLRNLADLMLSVYFPMERIANEVIQRCGFTIHNIVNWLMGSVPFSDPCRQRQLHEGIRAFLDGNSIVATHVLAPQIEAGVRRLADSLGQPRLQSRNPSGGPDEVRLLGSLLDDERVAAALGTAEHMRLRTLLVEPAGMNLRNNIAHGLSSDARLGMAQAFWLFHAVLALGCIRPDRDESEPKGES